MILKFKSVATAFSAAFLLLGFHDVCAQTYIPVSFSVVDTSIFQDAAHHWYDIVEKERIINPQKERPRYKPTQLSLIADNILLYQKNNGGWPKNYDMLAILTPEQKDSLIKTKDQENTTFDNQNTYSQIACLAKIYFVTKSEEYKKAALKGLDYILAAQYSNGGWPQCYPLQKNYSRFITYNDDVFSGIMKLLKDIRDNKLQYNFIDDNRREKLAKAFDKGIQCILKTQLNSRNNYTAWGQQYDEKSLMPVWARSFEPPAISNSESADVTLLLMSINKPDKKIIGAVQNAVKWFNTSKILGARVETVQAQLDTNEYTISKTDKAVIRDEFAAPIWARYHELKTHRPLFCDRGQKIVYSLAEVSRERRDGYAWYTYEPQKVLNRYHVWQKKWAPEENVLEEQMVAKE